MCDVKKIITNLVKKEQIKWSRETGIAKKLTEKFPGDKFWDQFGLDYELNSLAFLLSERGNGIVETKYKIFNSKKAAALEFKPVQKKEKYNLTYDQFLDTLD